MWLERLGSQHDNMKNNTKTVGFCDLGIADNFLEILTKKGFKIPTPIQKEIIPSALEGDDVVGIAQTGTGKTLAFGIPIIQRIAMHKGQALILVPTRELALQVEEVMRNIGKPLGLYCAVVMGGVPSYSQIQALKRKPHIVIATPGRLVDLMDQGVYTLDAVNNITLDEADRMLDIGFLSSIKRIISEAPEEKQIMLFSATMPKSIVSLAREFMDQPVRVEIAPQGTSSEGIEQSLFYIQKRDKMRLMEALLDEYEKDTVLIFSRTKHGAKKITRFINEIGHSATEIHSNRTQAQRKRALDGFIKKRYRVMVATDIAARGIDVDHITVVVNFDLPDCLEDYVHRIGRTGRAGRKGKAISFATPQQRRDVKGIERIVKKAIRVDSIPDLPEARAMAQDEKWTFNRGDRGRGSRSGTTFGRNKFQSRDRKFDGKGKKSTFDNSSRDKKYKSFDFQDASQGDRKKRKPFGKKQFSGSKGKKFVASEKRFAGKPTNGSRTAGKKKFKKTYQRSRNTVAS